MQSLLPPETIDEHQILESQSIEPSFEIDGTNEEEEEQPERFPVLRSFTDCFSLKQSMGVLLSHRVGGQFNALNGIRTLSCGYIILGR
jgi:hypothetical protein